MKLIKSSILFSILLGSVAPLVYATNTPKPTQQDARIRWVTFKKNDVVPIKASTFTTTQIVFGKGEFIENIQNGDLSAWSIDVTKSIPNMLFLKPTVIGSDTNLTVVTNRHTYYFHLLSLNTKKGKKSKVYALHFAYPHKIKSVHHKTSVLKDALHGPAHYNWDYSFNGSSSIKPDAVFDNGVFTYLQYGASQALPAIFAVDNRAGDESLVNVRRQGAYLVIEQIAPQFTLRLGPHQVATLFNNKEISRLNAGKSDDIPPTFFDDSEDE